MSSRDGMQSVFRTGRFSSHVGDQNMRHSRFRRCVSGAALEIDRDHLVDERLLVAALHRASPLQCRSVHSSKLHRRSSVSRSRYESGIWETDLNSLLSFDPAIFASMHTQCEKLIYASSNDLRASDPCVSCPSQVCGPNTNSSQSTTRIISQSARCCFHVDGIRMFFDCVHLGQQP